MDKAQAANTAASAAVAVAALVCVVTYAVLAPTWRRSAAGRHVMAMSAALGALGLYTVLITVWPDGSVASVFRAVRTVVVLSIAGLLVQRTWMVVRAQRKGGRGDGAA